MNFMILSAVGASPQSPQFNTLLAPHDFSKIEAAIAQLQSEAGVRVELAIEQNDTSDAFPPQETEEEDPDPSDRDSVYVHLDPKTQKIRIIPKFGTIEKISKASAKEWELSASNDWKKGSLASGLRLILNHIAQAYEYELPEGFAEDGSGSGSLGWAVLTPLSIMLLLLFARWAGSKEILWGSKTVGGSRLEVVISNRWPSGNLDKRAHAFLLRLRSRRNVDTLILVDRRSAQVGVAGQSIPGNSHSRLKQIAEDELSSTAMGRALERALARANKELMSEADPAERT